MQRQVQQQATTARMAPAMMVAVVARRAQMRPPQPMPQPMKAGGSTL